MKYVCLVYLVEKEEHRDQEGSRHLHRRTRGLQRGQGAQVMKFLFMIFHDEKTLDALPEPQMQTLVDSALDYMEELRRSGHFIVSNALQRAVNLKERVATL